jgi:hypothetical protein
MKRLHLSLLPVLSLLLACPATDGDDDDDAPTPTAEPTVCEKLDMPVRDFDADGPFGTLRRELADDFTVRDQNGDWSLRENWSGCESYVFIPDEYDISPLNNASIWTRDLDGLLQRSPLNVHYFFVSMSSSGPEVDARMLRISDQMDELLADLPEGNLPGERQWWADRLHLVQTGSPRIQNWVRDVLPNTGTGASTSLGFAIDRFQRIRGIGNIADVNRFSSTLNNAGMWPWENSMAYFANEPRYYNYEALRQARLDAQQDVTVVTLWGEGEVLSEFDEIEVDLPSAQEMEGFDTLEIDLTANCPVQNQVEFGNCGAWDYLAHIYIQDPDGVTWHEIARFITTYHREGRYVVDATPMLALMADGGTRRFRYVFAPPWNPQPTSTYLYFRFMNQGKGYRPTQAHYLYSGGGFNSSYNDGRDPIDIDIPAGALQTELWSIITGHGMNSGNCAEFCNHQHEFTVNGTVFLKDWPEVGNEEGCVDQVDQGTVPNQSGTWFFGRGGWCPGMQVDPWTEDVTSLVTPGQTTTVSYRGLFNNNTPPDDSGNIRMTSYLVVYE